MCVDLQCNCVGMVLPRCGKILEFRSGDTVKRSSLFLILFGLYLHGASGIALVQDSGQPRSRVSADSQTTLPSRIRIFGQNGAGAIFFKNSECAGGFSGANGIQVSGGFGSAFSSFFGSVENQRLGIPATESSENLSRKDGLASTAYFNEYEIPAEEPLSLRLSFRDVSNFYVYKGRRYTQDSPSCAGAIRFVPRAGEDYEVGFSWENSACSVSINQVIVKEGVTEVLPVKIEAAPDC